MITIMPWILGLLVAIIIGLFAIRQKTPQAKMGMAVLALVGILRRAVCIDVVFAAFGIGI